MNKIFFFICAILTVSVGSFAAETGATGPTRITPEYIQSPIDSGGPIKEYQETPPEKDQGVNNQQFDQFYAEFIKMMLMLGLVVVFLMVLAWLFKRLMNSRIAQINSQSVIQIIERRPLSPKTTLFLLDISGRQFLVAESQTGVSTMLEYSKRPNFNQMLEEEPKG